MYNAHPYFSHKNLGEKVHTQQNTNISAETLPVWTNENRVRMKYRKSSRLLGFYRTEQ